MKTINLILIILLTMVLMADASAGSIEFQLFTHSRGAGRMPQSLETTGDYLMRTADDQLSGNSDGCFSFNFMNPDAESDGYAKGIHPMTGAVTLDIDLLGGGSLDIESLTFSSAQSSTAQYLVQSDDPVTGTDGMPNNGTYAASASGNWAFEATFDWYYDTPYKGSGTIDMTFNNYQWDGFIIPVNELTTTGMAMTTLNDPLGYFAGTSEDFESWLLNEVKPYLPPEVAYLLFAQSVLSASQPAWSQCTGMSTDGIVGETIIAYAVPQCGDPNHPYPPGDMNQDCRVDLLDLAILALHWLECTAPE